MKPSRNSHARLAVIIFGSVLLEAATLMATSRKVISPAKLTDQNLKSQKLVTVPSSSKPLVEPSEHRELSGIPSTIEEKGAWAAEVPMYAALAFKSRVPPCTRCVVTICFQFAVIYFALALCRTYHEITGSAKGQLEAALRSAAQTLTYGPMICVLLLACRMQAEHSSHGKAEPQVWVQKCMYTLTFSVLMSTLLVLLIRLFSDEPLQLKGNPFDVERPFRGSSVGEPYWGWDQPLEEACSNGYRIAFYALTSIRYLVLLALFGGLGGVIVGIYTYLTHDGAPSMAIMCTIILAIAFFSTQLVVAVCSSISEFTRVDFPQVVGMMHASNTIVDFAPMLAVLFLAAHMRALQHDATLDDWVHNCMAASTGAMCVAALLAILVPLQLGATLKTNRLTSELRFELPKSVLGLGYIFIVMRYACMVCFYGGAIGVIKSIFVFESPGPMATVPVSLEEQCVVNLTCQFFLVYFLVTLVLTASEVTGGTSPIEKWSLFPAIEGARWTVAFAPMLSIIFMTTRMHALSVTSETGAPPAWVQDGMCLATWSLQMCGLSCLATDLFMAKPETSEHGKLVNKFKNWRIGLIIIVLRYIALLLMCRGLFAVIIDLLAWTPDSASAISLSLKLP
jgi:hypothetical protein